MYCIIANFGDDSVALIQKVYECKLQEVVVLSVDTFWQATSWQARVDVADLWIKDLGFVHHRLKAENSFQELVRARKQFPSQQFSWCAGFLKGMAILDWLEENDLECRATILLANRRSMSKVQVDLVDEIDETEQYDGRRVKYLLVGTTQSERNSLLLKTPFKIPLNHRSLECQPCIHLTKQDIATFSVDDIERMSSLENMVNNTMFGVLFAKYLKSIEKNDNYYDEFAKTCSWIYGCGL